MARITRDDKARHDNLVADADAVLADDYVPTNSQIESLGFDDDGEDCA